MKMKITSIKNKLSNKSIYEFVKNRKTSFLILLLVLFFGSGVFVGFNSNKNKDQRINLLNKENSEIINQTDFSSFWKAWNTIDKKYPGSENTKDQERVYGAISGLVSSLNDPYSVFFNPEETKTFQDDILGSFSGVGMEVGIKDKILTVISPLKNTPAYKAGIKSGDRILKIDDTSTANLSVEKAVKLIRGEKGTTVILQISNNGDKNLKNISIVRDTIDIPTIDTELRSDGIFVIKLYTFSANSSNLFRKAIKEFYESNSDKLLLDLRGNPGGYLDSSVNIASWFLDSGKPIVIEDYGNNKKKKIYRSEGYNVFTDKLKFVILINGGSASASEILAGAMQDYGRAKLVGEKSFGKGSVQEVVEITPDTILKITVAKWFTPKGNSISEKGLIPDYVVPITQKDIDNKIDPQLNKAINLLNNWQ
jgi:carboxyl-terminal processing protease